MGKQRLAYVNLCTSGKRQLEREPATASPAHNGTVGTMGTNWPGLSNLRKPFQQLHPRAHLCPASLHAAAGAAPRAGGAFLIKARPRQSGSSPRCTAEAPAREMRSGMFLLLALPLHPPGVDVPPAFAS